MRHFTKEGSKDNTNPTVNMAYKVEINDAWVVDSGATKHKNYKHELLKNRTSNTLEPSVTIPNGDTVPVERKGNCMLQNEIIIERVLHIPKFNCNLLYVIRLTKELECAVTFLPDFCYMQGLPRGI